MVNVAGGLRGLGASLAYLGQQGIAEQQRVDADQRLLDREEAFASFNQKIRNQDLDTDVDRDITKIKLETPHRVAARVAELTATEPFAERSEGRLQDRTERNRAADNSEWTRRNQIQFNNQIREIGVRADTETAHRLQEYQLGIGGGAQPRYLENGETNTYTAVYPDGRQEDTGVEYRRRSSDVDDDDGGGGSGDITGVASTVREVARAARGGRTPGRLSPRGVSTGQGQPPIPGARQAADGNWYIQRNGRTFRVDR